LATTEEAISAIALAAGFADQSHLTRALRARTGMTPARYRREHRR
jgi:AraC-like DNA-binding protein